MADHNEKDNGELAFEHNSPTPIVLSSGNNIVTGSTIGGGNPPGDRDYFTFDVPAGSTVSAIVLESYTWGNGELSSPGYGKSYFAVIEGNSFPDPGTLTTSSNLEALKFKVSKLIDNKLIDTSSAATREQKDLLEPEVGITTFNVPEPRQLGPGVYSVWYQETGENTTYKFNIVLDTPPPPTVEFSQPTYQVNEDGSIVGATVTLTRTGYLNLDSKVQVSITGGSATAGSDYDGSAFPLNINFASGEASKEITIPILQDAVFEGIEGINLEVISSSYATIGTQNTAALQILDDENSTGSGGQTTFVIKRGDSTTITDFGGVGTGTNPSLAVIVEVDTLKFEGAGLTAQNMLLTQNGADLEITFEGVADTNVTLQNFELENLENLANLGNIWFDGQTSIQDSFDVFNADSTNDTIFNPNTVTFLNNRPNAIKGFNNSKDVINGQKGRDQIDGRDGHDLLRGGAGKDTLLGGNGKDILSGGDGHDSLIGGNDNDTVTGGAGKDTFTFNQKREGVDEITDFSVADDIIQVSQAGFAGGLKKGGLKADQFVIGSAAKEKGDRFIYNQSTGALFFDGDGKGGTGQVQIAKLSTGLAMTNNDIHVIA
jgi:Ca2+-binding RTX toxin-like protein